MKKKPVPTYAMDLGMTRKDSPKQEWHCACGAINAPNRRRCVQCKRLKGRGEPRLSVEVAQSVPAEEALQVTLLPKPPKAP